MAISILFDISEIKSDIQLIITIKVILAHIVPSVFKQKSQPTTSGKNPVMLYDPLYVLYTAIK